MVNNERILDIYKNIYRKPMFHIEYSAANQHILDMYIKQIVELELLAKQKFGLVLLTELVKQKKAIKEALLVAQNAVFLNNNYKIHDDNKYILSDILDAGINLFRVLLEDTDTKTKEIVTEHIQRILSTRSIWTGSTWVHIRLVDETKVRSLIK